MSKKMIFSVGFEFPDDSEKNIKFHSNESLLDSDIVVFSPILPAYKADYFHPTFEGKKSLAEESSFTCREHLSHWRRELITAYNSNKTIFIFLDSLTEFFIRTGKKEISGTGKNARTTNIVELFNNYKCIPYLNGVVPVKGKLITPISDLKYLTNYWAEFEKYSQYELYFDCNDCQPVFKTKNGNKFVGGILEGDKNKGEGVIFFLPKIEYKYSENEGHKLDINAWSKKLANTFFEIDKAIKSESNRTPKPDWIDNPIYKLKLEEIYKSQVQDINKKIEELEENKIEVKKELTKANNIKGLLYEKGTPLESSIIEALNLLGLNAENYKDSSSEFDAVFTCKEGAFLCEAEGKDSKAIDVTKIRQLTTNLQEYHDKEGVFPKGILFGNSYRYTPD